MARKIKRPAQKRGPSTAALARPSRRAPLPLGTVLLVLAFASLVGIYAWLNTRAQGAAAEATPGETVRALFDPSYGGVTNIEIVGSEGERVSMRREEGEAWTLLEPAGMTADQALIDQAATELTGLTIEAELTGAPEDFGLENPAHVIRVGFANSGLHSLEVGDLTPTSSGYYVRLDGGAILKVGRFGIEALTDLVLSPPIAATETPYPVPTQTSPPESTPVIDPPSSETPTP